MAFPPRAHSRLRAAAAVAAVLASIPATATPTTSSRPDDHRRPYRVRLAVDLPLTAGLAAAAAAPYGFPSLITPSCPCDRSEVNRFDRFAIGHHSHAASVASDVTAGAAVLLPPLADALHVGIGPALGEDVVVLSETLAVNSALVVAAKYLTQRPLPITYEGDPAYVHDAKGYRSFYSGHTSTVVAALTASAWTIRLRDGERGWPWALVALGGASVGAERIAAGRHFPTDVLVGAAAGLGVGTAVPLLHRRHHAPLVLLPARDGLAVAGVF